MSEQSPSPREANPYAAPLAPGAAIDSSWPDALDLVYAAALFIGFYAAMCAGHWLFEDDVWYFVLMAPGAMATSLTMTRYHRRTRRTLPRWSKTIIAAEMTALFFVPTFFLALDWSMTAYPLIEVMIGAAVTFISSIAARAYWY